MDVNLPQENQTPNLEEPLADEPQAASVEPKDDSEPGDPGVDSNEPAETPGEENPSNEDDSVLLEKDKQYRLEDGTVVTFGKELFTRPEYLQKTQQLKEAQQVFEQRTRQFEEQIDGFQEAKHWHDQFQENPLGVIQHRLEELRQQYNSNGAKFNVVLMDADSGEVVESTKPIKEKPVVSKEQESNPQFIQWQNDEIWKKGRSLIAEQSPHLFDPEVEALGKELWLGSAENGAPFDMPTALEVAFGRVTRERAKKSSGTLSNGTTPSPGRKTKQTTTRNPAPIPDPEKKEFNDIWEERWHKHKLKNRR